MLVRAAVHSVWNRCDFPAADRISKPGAVLASNAGRIVLGQGQLRASLLSIAAVFLDVAVKLDDVYWMGNRADGFVAACRWSGVGTHRGHGPYGEPTGRRAALWRILQWEIEQARCAGSGACSTSS
jgi:hypothetical protein